MDADGAGGYRPANENGSGGTMESLFRFAIVRPATAVASEHAIAVERASRFQAELLAVIDQPRPRKALKHLGARQN